MKTKIFDPRTKTNKILDDRGDEIQKIYKYYIEDLDRLPSSIIPDDVRYNKNKNKIKFKKNRISKKKTKNNQFIHYQSIVGNPTSQLYKILKSYRGKQVKLDLIGYNGDIKTKTVTIPSSKFGSVWGGKQGIFHWLQIDSDEYYFGQENDNFDLDSQSTLNIYEYPSVKGKKHSQKYAEGFSHCVLTAPHEWILENLENQEPGSSGWVKWNRKKNWMEKRNHPKEGIKGGFIKTFEQGIPEDKLQFVCDKIHTDFKIDIPSQYHKDNHRTHEIKTKNRSSYKVFEYLNVRLNHCEFDEYSKIGDEILVSYQEIKRIKKELDEKNEYHVWNGDDNIYKLTTLDKSYLVESEYKKVMDEFKEKNNLDLDHYYIYHNRDRELSEFVISHINTNQSRNFVKGQEEIDLLEKIETLKDYEEFSIEELKENKVTNKKLKKKIRDRKINNPKWWRHIDMTKSYARSQSCKYYEGFLGKIMDFRECDQIEKLGIYVIDNIDFSACKFPILDMMNAYHNKVAYPSPELKFLKEKGIQFDILCGCWGTRFDMDLYDERLMEREKINDDPSSGTEEPQHYKKFYGKCMSYYDTSNTKFKCDTLDFAEIIQHYNPESEINFDKDGKYGIITSSVKNPKHHSHIACFINSYARISIMEQLCLFEDVQDILRVNVDGIFFKKSAKFSFLKDKGSDLFIEKEGIDKFNQDEEYYVDTRSWSREDCETGEKVIGKYQPYYHREVHLGPGGTGKTHNLLVDKGLVNVLFVSPTYKLKRNKMKEYDCQGEVHAGLTITPNDKNKSRIDNIKNYNVLVIDEISMLSNKKKQEIIKNYPDHKIIFCGDVGYQLPPFDPDLPEGEYIEEFQCEDGWFIKQYGVEDMKRCKCERLKRRLIKIRELIDEDEYNIDLTQKLDWAKILRMEKNKVDVNFMKENYNYKEDLVIARSHRMCDKYNEILKEHPKYKILKTSEKYSNGEMVCDLDTSSLSKEHYELRNCYTIHAIQGETATGKLFIELNNVSDLRMLYTALSRAEYLDQIYLIDTF